jgi:catechol 2,3-dioxygenase-like lactoylglutathione lyase family enzyme
MKLTYILTAAGLAMVLGAAALAQPPAPPAAAPVGKNIALPAAIAPTSLGSVGITVTDLEKMKDFYVQVLGFKVVRMVGTNEYVLNLNQGGGAGANLVLLRGTRQPGATSWGRVILYMPDADAAAKVMTENGWPARKVGGPTDRAYFIRDPEGNNFEFYTPNAPAAAPARKG